MNRFIYWEYCRLVDLGSVAVVPNDSGFGCSPVCIGLRPLYVAFIVLRKKNAVDFVRTLIDATAGEFPTKFTEYILNP